MLTAAQALAPVELASRPLLNGALNGEAAAVGRCALPTPPGIARRRIDRSVRGNAELKTNIQHASSFIDHAPVGAQHNLYRTYRRTHCGRSLKGTSVPASQSEEWPLVLSESRVVHNQLLAALPSAALKQLLPNLCRAALPLRQGLYHPDVPIKAVYFPEAGMISLVANMDDGMQAEVGVIGREGMLGVPLLLGVDTSFVEAMVQVPGTALRMGAREFRHALEVNASLRTLLLRYNEAQQAQVMQTAACNGRHALKQRLARWLLMVHDRSAGDELPLTQDLMAMVLGVHRPSVTVVASALQRAGLVRYSGGRVTVLDRPSLEAASCECYALVKRRFMALLGTATP